MSIIGIIAIAIAVYVIRDGLRTIAEDLRQQERPAETPAETQDRARRILNSLHLG
jgi:hypothetical protein